MATVDGLIDVAVARANSFANLAQSAIGLINTGTFTPGDPGDVTVDASDFAAKYEKPSPDTTPPPVYVAPPVDYPDPVSLVELSDIKVPSIPPAPDLNLNGLFLDPKPSSNIPDWSEQAPELMVDSLYAELSALPIPTFNEVEIPNISAVNIRQAPTLQLPDYETYATPEAVPAAVDYASYMKSRYDAALPEMKAFVDGIVELWIQKYAPDYYEQRDKLHEKLMAGMEGQILPDQFESALFSRARARIDAEYRSAERSILEQSEKRGFLIPSAATTSALNKARLDGAKSLSANSTEIYIERRKMEVQHLQFILQLAASQVQGVRSLALQYAQTGLSLMQQANVQADALTQKLITRFEHERSRREFSLAIMKALNEQYEVKLKAALSGLEGYKLELQAIELQTNVEAKRVDAARAKIEAQEILVRRYSAMVDAIAKRAAVDELKIKEYGIRADVFKTNIQARLATFEAYKASIDGDKAKLQGELARLQVYENQLKVATLDVDVQSKVLDAGVKTNAAKLSQFTGELDAYKVASQVALQKFTAEAEIKKLGMDLYKTNVQANIAVFEGELKKDIAIIQAEIDAYKARIAEYESYSKVMIASNELTLKKTATIAEGYSNMASASLQALNTSVTKATAE